ncbi:MFS transporter [Trichlorobacter ammonificans]|uniref:Uncharacterized MFS-type transporter YybF n=1 Tax=Trichlorobacter ammonificans TaxID=2916410 RepID=A0ABN8HFQ1_9BACT|nr:MFS transporter [Trichlorobacter ammonificans]CAH2031680.1 Uncharacterized MFS-type transporter YybF [Trichlorobacter ammonificans]
MTDRGEGRIEQGTLLFHRVNLALFIAGFITFSTLYDFQPLLPVLVADFNVTPAFGSLALSVATGALAVTLPVSGSISDALGRRPMMMIAVVVTSLLALASALCRSLELLIVLRLVQGAVLAGVPAVAMAYLNEELAPGAVGRAMGLYIAGNAIGGMTGRILTAWIADYLPWRGAIGCIGGLSLALALLFILLIPASRHFRSTPFRLLPLSRSLVGHLARPQLLCLFAVSFTGMGAFVTLYNYVTFRLLAPPYLMSQSQVALIFVSYALGAFGSGMMGGLVERFGRRAALLGSLLVMASGGCLTLLAPAAAIIAGIALFTLGFFGAHTVASTWVGFLATSSRAQASSLYLFAYYLGSSISGTGGGFFWSSWGWPGVILLVLTLICAALAATLLLAKLSRPAGSS